MLLAAEAGLSGEDYVFFHLDLFGQSLQGAHGLTPRRPWERGDGLDVSAHKAFQVSVGAGLADLGGSERAARTSWAAPHPPCLYGFQKRGFWCSQGVRRVG